MQGLRYFVDRYVCRYQSVKEGAVLRFDLFSYQNRDQVRLVCVSRMFE